MKTCKTVKDKLENVSDNTCMITLILVHGHAGIKRVDRVDILAGTESITESKSMDRCVTFRDRALLEDMREAQSLSMILEMQIKMA